MTIPTSSENSDPSPFTASQLRDLIVAELNEMGWSVSAAADTGFSTTVMLNEEMIGASVDMAELFESEDAGDSGSQKEDPKITVFAFSFTVKNEIDAAPGTLVRTGTPEVTVARHQTLGLNGCQSHVLATGYRETDTARDIASRTIAAIASSVEQFRLLTC